MVKLFALVCLGTIFQPISSKLLEPVMTAFGFDLEHRSLTTREVEALLAFSHLYDIDLMVRPPTLEKTGTLPLLGGRGRGAADSSRLDCRKSTDAG